MVFVEGGMKIFPQPNSKEDVMKDKLVAKYKSPLTCTGIAIVLSTLFTGTMTLSTAALLFITCLALEYVFQD